MAGPRAKSDACVLCVCVVAKSFGQIFSPLEDVHFVLFLAWGGVSLVALALCFFFFYGRHMHMAVAEGRSMLAHAHGAGKYGGQGKDAEHDDPTVPAFWR